MKKDSLNIPKEVETSSKRSVDNLEISKEDAWVIYDKLVNSCFQLGNYITLVEMMVSDDKVLQRSGFNKKQLLEGLQRTLDRYKSLMNLFANYITDQFGE